MKTLAGKRWIQLVAFSLLIHGCYLGFVLVNTGSVLSRKGWEAVMVAMKLDRVANILTASVYQQALDRTESAVIQDLRMEPWIERGLAMDDRRRIPDSLKHFGGRGLIKDQQVIDISALEEEMIRINTGIVPEAVEFPKDLPPDVKDREVQIPQGFH
jgi:hypothetical protein